MIERVRGHITIIIIIKTVKLINICVRNKTVAKKLFLFIHADFVEKTRRLFGPHSFFVECRAKSFTAFCSSQIAGRRTWGLAM